jgi:hypothetical protein
MESFKPSNVKDKFNPNPGTVHTEEWNPIEWQGRSKRQVEDNQKITGIAIISLAIIFISMIIYNAITNGI